MILNHFSSVNLGVMIMNRYSIFLKAPELVSPSDSV